MTIRGIDVSEHNGIVDWQRIKDSGIQFAVIRSSWGHFVEDTMLRRNVSECERVGMPYGLYHYSYVFNDATLQEEIRGFTNLIQQFRPLYPCYVDMEDADGFLAEQGVVNDIPFLTRVAKSFCQAIESVNYYAGIYANLYWFETKLYSDELNPYDRWLAQWASAPTFAKPFGMWQYTSDGSVPGSSARTDMNIAYIDYPTVIKEKGLNIPSGGKPIPPKPEPGKSYHVGDVVSFHEIYSSSTSTQPLTPAITRGTITKIVEGARNPYLINDGTGWINNGSIDGSNSGGVKHRVGETVSFHKIYVSSTSTEALKPSVTTGTITRIISGAPNPYLINNGTGWVNDESITSGQGGSAGTIQVGSRVRVKEGSADYNGTPLASFVYQTTYTVMEIKGDRAVIGLNGAVTAAVKLSDLSLA